MEQLFLLLDCSKEQQNNFENFLVEQWIYLVHYPPVIKEAHISSYLFSSSHTPKKIPLWIRVNSKMFVFLSDVRLSVCDFGLIWINFFTKIMENVYFRILNLKFRGKLSMVKTLGISKIRT